MSTTEATVKLFEEFVLEKNQHRDTAGIAIIYDGQILLAHPANGSWTRPIMGIPKGKIEVGEDILEAAVRETKEEIGIEIDPDKIKNSLNTIDIYDKNGNFRNTLYYYEYRIDSLSEIDLENITVPKYQLQKEEIDWAGFVKISQAYEKIAKAQRIILDRAA